MYAYVALKITFTLIYFQFHVSQATLMKTAI